MGYVFNKFIFIYIYLCELICIITIRTKYDGSSDTSILRKLYFHSDFDSSTVKSIYSPVGDGQCGFRSLAMSLYGDQNKWTDVKDQMLETYLKYKNTWYISRIDDPPRMTRILSCKLSPCTVDTYFDYIDCPQIAADTFGRIIAMYSISLDLDGSDYYSSTLFFPFTQHPKSTEVINIFLTSYHYYLIEPAKTENGSTVGYILPLINPFCHAFYLRFPELKEFDISHEFKE